LTALALLRRYWKLIGFGILAMLLAVQTARLSHAKGDLEREKINNNELRAELKAISDAKNRQKAETGRNIAKAEKGERDAAPIVKIIREAPIGPNCSTPGIDILRNEI
jgi:hypothetical protein